jgi:hypothetical protein
MAITTHLRPNIHQQGPKILVVNDSNQTFYTRSQTWDGKELPMKKFHYKLKLNS